MSIAGVQLADGRRVWISTESHHVRALDTVRIRLADGVACIGVVFLAPTELVDGNPEPAGVLLSVDQVDTAAEDTDLPGVDLPPLGTHLLRDDGRWRVTALDPVSRTVTLEQGGQTLAIAVDAEHGFIAPTGSDGGGAP